MIEPALRWERDGGTVTRIRVDSGGVLDLAELQKAVAQPDAALVSIMWANNETGVIVPMADAVRSDELVG